ncbi:MAG: RNase P subunit p30 family protein [Nanobdellota archaeon]
MYYDVVCPNGNEREFIEMAKRLGYGGICFLYEEKIPTNQISDERVVIFSAVIARDSRKAERKADLFFAKEVTSIRNLIEKGFSGIILGAENQKRKDFIHQRNSGVDHIICEFAKKKGTAFGFSFNDLITPPGSRFVGRVIQNIRLFQKYNLDAVICSLAQKPYEMRNPRDLISLYGWLGLISPKLALSNLGKLVKTYKKKSKDKISEGIEVVE